MTQSPGWFDAPGLVGEDSSASETRARVKITPREKSRFSLPAACRLFSRGVIFTRARVSLALLSLRKNGGLLVVYLYRKGKWKATGAEMCPASVSGMVTGDVPVSYWLIVFLALETVPEVFAKVNSS